ncbi:hypothetical protein [Flavobacterium sp.]|uniref:hypothetical protein n=1 Tax=Flavobacterium sp. TaxID=239 RepID=UPI0025DAC8CA|nr:hypothetical protein [Flavobacterium sp.]
MRTKTLANIKMVLVLLILFFLQITNAQAPQKMSYQAVVRNLSSALIVSSPVGMRISILQSSASGSSVYTETQTSSTNVNGLVSLEIGTGTVVSGNFATINWATGPYFIKTETDPTGGTSYTITGTSQLSSVPYALFSAGSANGETPGTAVGDMKYWNGTAWTMIPIGTPGQFLQINNSNIPTWIGGSFPTLTTISNPSQTYFEPNPAGFWGNVTNVGITGSGGSVISSYGVCWSIAVNPTLGGTYSLIPGSTGLGNFYAQLTSLLPNTTYHVRAFVINSTGVTYGNDVIYTTFNPTLPTVTTTPVTAITGGTASSGGTISNDGGSAISQKGICWSTSPSPTIADNITTNGAGSTAYTSIASGLLTSTVYYIRSYATSIAGTAYGNQVSFTTTSTLSIGSFYQGGVIGYFLQPGDPGYSSIVQHGIIISQNNIGTADFGCYNVTYPNPFGNAIGDGINNTTNIVAGCSTLGIAAEVCLNLVLNTYSDWFLPCTGEWTAVGTNYSLLPLDIGGYYLTSNTNGASNQNILTYYTGGGFGSGVGAFPYKAFRLF